jgi:DNA-binding response OmpR family regulator
VTDRVKALDAGVDDYLIKPFSIDELMARLRAMHRRMATFASPSNDGSVQTELLQVADLSMNTRTRDVRRGDKSIHLSVKEYDLLNFLMRRSGRVLERQEIMRGVWGENFFGDDNLLDVYIRYLRQKIEIDSNLTLIHTIRGVGFILRAQEAN